MDSDETYTPRSGRKKKSTLSKLAARGRRKVGDSTDSENLTESRIPNGRVSQDSAPKYPIDANVEIRRNADGDEDSDEGIEVANDTLSSIDRRFNGAANDRVQSSGSTSEDQGFRERTDANHNSKAVDSPQLNRFSRAASRDNFEEADLSRASRSNKSSARRLVMSDPEDLLDKKKDLSEGSTGNVMNVREALESESYSFLQDPKPGMSSVKDALNDPDIDASNSPFRSNLIRNKLSRSEDDLATRYRESLSKAEAAEEEDKAEKQEMNDSISALRQDGPKAFVNNTMRSSTTQSLFGSYDRTWGSMQKVGGYDTMSQRSFQSTSVLPLISTKEARNRSFLVGSMSGRAALMGLEEMERFFPDHKMRIFTGTWNMYDMKLLPDSLDDWLLPDASDYIQDMYVIGTQESCPYRKEWEIRLQETLGPSHVLFHTAVHGVLYLCVFLRRDLIWFCSVSEESTATTRLGPTNVATKGAVALCFTFFGTSFLFLNSHLAPHDGKVKERIADYHKITTNINLPQIVMTNTYTSSQDDVTARFDCVFWMGDLNFRLEKERDRVDNAMNAMTDQEIPSYEDLMKHDELFRVRNEGLAFQDFQEGRIKFRPTYKFDKGTDNYDTSKKLRIPSYTDRILFRSRKKSTITCLHYDSAFSMKDSDHKPVYAMFEVSLRPGKDNIPLAAGQFNREVWLEGNRRRAERLANQKQRSKASSVCSIQ